MFEHVFFLRVVWCHLFYHARMESIQKYIIIYIYVCVKVFNSIQKYNMHIKKERESS